nr:reverse transcriptase domain-containing protein [Tanacetum cinerariifolium]
LPEFETFCFDDEEISSGSTTTHPDISLLEYEAFHDDHVKEIGSGSPTTPSDISLSKYDSFIFDLLINTFPPVDRSDSYEFTDELIPFISAPEYDCFRFMVEPNSRDFTNDVVENISPMKEPQVLTVLPTHPTLQLNLKFPPFSEYLFAYVVWTILPFLVYSVVPCYLLSLRNEDIIFDPGICNYHFSKPDISHRCRTVKKFNTHRELTLRVGKEAITFNLDQTSRYSANYNDMTANQIDVIDMSCEEYSQEVLSFSNVITSGNPTPYYDPIVSTTSSTLTPFENSDFLFEEVDAFLALEDDPTSPEVNQSYLDSKRDILLLEAFLNDDPSLPPPNQGNYLPEVELKDLPPQLEYVFLKGNDKLPVIIAKDLIVEEKTALITVLNSHKQAIAWKLSDIKGIDPEF